MTFRRAFFAAFSTAVLLGLAWGCAATGDSGGGNPGGGANSGPLLPPKDASLLMPGQATSDAGHLRVSPLCHRTDDSPPCVPDSPISCVVFKPTEDAGTADASTADATMGEDAANEDASTSEEASTSVDASTGGQPGEGGSGGAGGDSAGPAGPSGAGEGGSSGAGEGGAAGTTSVPPVTSATYGCQVQRTEAEPDVPFSRCALAGPGAENAPCLTSSDCQAGLGCVVDPVVGSTCLKFCCQDADVCAHGSYCAERPLRDAITNGSSSGEIDRTPLQIPVCVPAQNCDLSAPYPCVKGSECMCETGTACTVVRADGTTTCTVPGTGKAGEKCPCAWGHICGAATSTCLKLCDTRDESPCGDGKCQSASQLPAGWGVCVGTVPSGG